MESFIEMCDKFRWAKKLKLSYKRLVRLSHDEEKTVLELDRLLTRSTRYVEKQMCCIEQLENYEEVTNFLELLILNLNAANSELPKEFPNFDDRLIPLVDKYSELLVFHSKHSSTGLPECLSRMATFLQELSVHPDHDTSKLERTQNLLLKITRKYSQLSHSNEVNADEGMDTDDTEPLSVAPSENNEVTRPAEETAKKSKKKRVTFDEASTKIFDAKQWEDADSEIPVQEPDATDEKKLSQPVFFDDYLEEEDNETIGSTETESLNDNSSMTEGLEVETDINNSASETKSEETNDPVSTTKPAEESSVSLSEEAKPEESRISAAETKSGESFNLAYDFSSDDEDNEPTTSLDSILASLASPDSCDSSITSPGSQKPSPVGLSPSVVARPSQRDAGKAASPIRKPVKSNRKRILSDSSDEESSEPRASLFSHLRDETSTCDTGESGQKAPRLEIDPEEGKVDLKTRTTSVVESATPDKPSNCDAKVNQPSDDPWIIPESPIKDNSDPPPARVIAIPAIREITPVNPVCPYDFPVTPPPSTTPPPDVIPLKSTTTKPTKKKINRLASKQVLADSPITASRKLNRKVIKGLSVPVHERRLLSGSKWTVTEAKERTNKSKESLPTCPLPSPLPYVLPDGPSQMGQGRQAPSPPSQVSRQGGDSTTVFTELKRSMEGNLLGCDASLSDAEVLEEIESSVHKWSGSEENDDDPGPVNFAQESEDDSVKVIDIATSSVSLPALGDSAVKPKPAKRRSTKKEEDPLKDETSAASSKVEPSRRSSRLAGKPCLVPLSITHKMEPVPSKKRRTMAPSIGSSPKDSVATHELPPLTPITWEEVSQQLPPCWVKLIDQHVRETGQANKLEFREGSETSRLVMYCRCSSSSTIDLD